MKVHIERIKSLFPKDVCEQMLKIPTDYGQCAYNSAKAAIDYKRYNVQYCEGWLHDVIGHAFNKMVDENGNEHYFDISQEYIKLRDHTKGGLKDAELEKVFDTLAVVETFDADKEAHLISVPKWKGQHTYEWYKERGQLYFY